MALTAEHLEVFEQILAWKKGEGDLPDQPTLRATLDDLRRTRTPEKTTSRGKKTAGAQLELSLDDLSL